MKKIVLLLLLSSKLLAQQPSKTIDFNNFMLIERVEDQEKQYQELIKANAGKSLPDSLTNDLRAELAFAWLAKGNVERYTYYKSTSPSFTARQFLYLSNALEKLFDDKKDYRSVEKITSSLLEEIKTGKLADDMQRTPVFMQLNAASNARLGNVAKAKAMLDATTKIIDESVLEIPYFKDTKSNFIHRKAIVLLAAGQAKEAYDLLEQAFKNADSNPDMLDTFKESYQKVKGNHVGFEDYLHQLKEEAYQKYYKEVEKLYVTTPELPLEGKIPDPDDADEMVTTFTASRPVQDIVLKKLDGKQVNLGNYGGQVLVIDFWTTLCTPCVAAFSGFEKVVSEFGQDQLQLFAINLFETDATVKAYVAQKGIKLAILHDEENLAYDVKATPTKIVFDPQGNIRFFSSGYAGSTDREYYKLKAMVEIAKKGVSNVSKS